MLQDVLLCIKRRILPQPCRVCQATTDFILSAVTAGYYSEFDENKTGTYLCAEWIEVRCWQRDFGCCIACLWMLYRMSMDAVSHVMSSMPTSLQRCTGLFEAHLPKRRAALAGVSVCVRACTCADLAILTSGSLWQHVLQPRIPDHLRARTHTHRNG